MRVTFSGKCPEGSGGGGILEPVPGRRRGWKGAFRGGVRHVQPGERNPGELYQNLPAGRA